MPWSCPAAGCPFSTFKARTRGEHLLSRHQLIFCGDRNPPRVPSPVELAERQEALRRRNRGQQQRDRERRREGEGVAAPGVGSGASAQSVAGSPFRPVVARPPVVSMVVRGDDDSDIDFDELMGPTLDVGPGEESWEGLEVDALNIPVDEPIWHEEWVVVPFIAPPPPPVELLPRGVSVADFAAQVMAVRDAGWPVAVDRVVARFGFTDDELPMVRLAVQLVWLGRRWTSNDALRIVEHGLAEDPSGFTSLLQSVNFLSSMGVL